MQYADLADLSANAPVIVQATVKKAVKVSPERAPNAPIGTERYYVEASTDALIRGRGGIPDVIRYVIDLPLDSRGRAPKIKRQTFIIFAQNGTGSAGNIQLVARDAQILWTPDRDARVRALVREIVRQDAPPTINGIVSAFHVPGTIIGEGETQIFLKTENGQPVSITILSRDGQKKRWAVSLGEIVDEAAKAPVRNSLLWYRLACFLPRDLPFEALEGVSPSNANQARLDYRMVIQDLGNCPRARRADDR
ncbi:hypothetical protein HF685_14475 [Parasphingorhabdus halotolerans]|uniref:Uncharacterized protein n=1 Tax=Parasphingorhabdus halotolerans TaxID=2725558 RepID=A0A6H2DRN6_9SPHN|nr:hypothetical protein HF685_14475 [Parasphingorhabdus halotolerans]